MNKSRKLKELGEHLGFEKDKQLAKYLDVKPNTFSNWIKRNTYDAELIYTKCDFLNTEWLFSENVPMLKTSNEVNENMIIYTRFENLTPSVITVDTHQNDNIVLVPVKAQAGYLNSYDDPEFMQELPVYSLPNMKNGIFRMFQIEGNSMFPTMHDGSYAVGQFVENWIDDIKDGRIYIVVTVEGIIIKRVLNRIKKYDNLFCKSDNRRDYPNVSVKTEDIREIWECKLHLLFNLPDPADMYDRMNDLEADLSHLNHIIQKNNLTN